MQLSSLAGEVGACLDCCCRGLGLLSYVSHVKTEMEISCEYRDFIFIFFKPGEFKTTVSWIGLQPGNAAGGQLPLREKEREGTDLSPYVGLVHILLQRTCVSVALLATDICSQAALPMAPCLALLWQRVSRFNGEFCGKLWQFRTCNFLISP